MILEFFAINVSIMATIVIYFIAGSKIEKFIERRLLKSSIKERRNE